jgi:hypothetical protein
MKTKRQSRSCTRQRRGAKSKKPMPKKTHQQEIDASSVLGASFGELQTCRFFIGQDSSDPPPPLKSQTHPRLCSATDKSQSHSPCPSLPGPGNESAVEVFGSPLHP